MGYVVILLYRIFKYVSNDIVLHKFVLYVLLIVF